MTIECIGAIDQGTQSTRFLLYNTHGEVIASHQEEFPQHNPHAGCVSDRSCTNYAAGCSCALNIF